MPTGRCRDGPYRHRRPADEHAGRRLLLLARLDQGRPLRREPVSLTRIVDDAVADARALEPERPIDAAIEPDVLVTGDKDRLRQVVGNLLANVRVHTPQAARVDIAVKRDVGFAELPSPTEDRAWTPSTAPRLRPLLPGGSRPGSRQRRDRPWPLDRDFYRRCPRRRAVARADAGRRRDLRGPPPAHSDITARPRPGFRRTRRPSDHRAAARSPRRATIRRHPRVKLSKTLVLPVAALLVVGAAGAVFAATGTPPRPGPTPSSRPRTPRRRLPPRPHPRRSPRIPSCPTCSTGWSPRARSRPRRRPRSSTRWRRSAPRAGRSGSRNAEQLKGFLSDGVITQDELGQTAPPTAPSGS